ncbi:Vacuolar sorting-associated 3 protein [Rutstroemia sp. NJR-2017a BBW]|nr:Vacuolar sorting-associated 3 protein [Rutstroemia sp. NJR-2017a BBW]
MADDIIEQITPHIHEILRIVLVKGRSLRELNELVGKTIQNYHIESDREVDTSRPIYVEFKHLRRSDRLTTTKRTYEKMHTNTGTGRQAKKPKLADENISTDALPTNGASKELAIDEYTSETAAETSANPTANSKSTTSEPATNRPYIDNINTVEAPKPSDAADLPTSTTHIQNKGGEIASLPPDGDMFPITHSDGLNILDKYFGQSAIGLGPANDVEGLEKWPICTAESIYQDKALGPAVWSNPPAALAASQHPPTASSETTDIIDLNLTISSTAVSESSSSTGSSESGSISTSPTSYPSYETHHVNCASVIADRRTHSVKRPILDESAQWLEHVLIELEAIDNISRKPNSSVPGVLDDISIQGNFAICVKIMTSITENLVKCNRRIVKPIFEITQERSQVVERNKIGLRTERLTSERASRVLKEKDYAASIVCLGIRDLAEKEMQKLLSEPEELTSEFREESDYETAIKCIEKEKADDARIQLRRLWKETYYWPMIQQRAKMIGPLPNPSGRKTEITPQEKAAAKKLILAMGYGKSRDNIFKWTAYWKLLSELRDERAIELILYRTREFKAYFFQHPKELKTLLSWNRVYDFPLRQLRVRTIAEEGNDFSGKSDIEEPWILSRLHAPQHLCWGDHLSIWDHDSTEYENFLADHRIKPTSGKSNIHVLRHGLKGQSDHNKSSFVSLVPYEGESGKRTLGTRRVSSELLAVVPLVPILPGDFLGIFSGRLRYTDQKPPRSIPGPVSNLWLDYSEVMGKLSRIGVAKANELTNVCLAWEGVNEVKEETSFCQYLRIVVIATRHIMPYDQLVRPSVV